MSKTKFSKKKCSTCIYHKKFLSAAGSGIYCDYCSVTGHTCLQRVGSQIIDTRGDDYHNCKLYEKGASIHAKVNKYSKL